MSAAPHVLSLDPSNRSTPVLQLETRDVPITIVGVGRDGLRAMAACPLQLSGKVKVRFPSHPRSIRMLAEVVSCRSASGDDMRGTEICIRYRALHSPASQEHLINFLRSELRVSQISLDGFLTRENGWFYRFPKPGPALVPGPATMASEEDEAPETRRREERVSVRSQVSLELGGEWVDGTAYNVSSSGIFLLSNAAALPERGTRTSVIFPLSQGEGRKIILTGEICWTAPSMEATGGGIGIRIERVEDGENGAAWARFIAGETDFGGALDVDLS